MLKAFRFFILLFSLLVGREVVAQSADSVAVPILPRVSVLTVSTGSDIYQLEGHTALRFAFADGRDVTVNWGVFDFNTPNFVYRFCKGETMYSIGLMPMQPFVDWYRDEGRRVTEQVLDLTPRQVVTILNAIEDNLRPENQTYRYNYVKDNCATRPLAMIELALSADSSKLVVNEQPEDVSFRSEMRGYHKNFPTYQMGIDLALGSGIDYKLTPRERAFAPVYLERLLASAEIENADGSRRNLVSSTVDVLKETQSKPRESLPSPWIWTGLVFAAAAVVSVIDIRRNKTNPWFDTVFYLVFGLGGCIVAFLVFVSTHEATSPNLNLLWLNPLSLIVPAFIWIKSCRRLVYWYQICNFALLIAFIVGIGLSGQSFNWFFAPLIGADMLRALSYIKINRPKTKE